MLCRAEWDEEMSCALQRTGSLRARLVLVVAAASVAYLSLCGLQGERALAAPPTNDAFASPIEFGGSLPSTQLGTTVDATAEPGEPEHTGFGFGGTSTVWFRWTPSTSEVVRIDVCNSSTLSALGVYTGAAVSALTRVGTTEIENCSNGMRVRLAASAGTTYRIAVANASVSSPGPYSLSFASVGPPKTLSVAKDGTGTGVVFSSPTGIDCGSDCSESFEEGTEVILRASPDTGSVFAGWSGGGCSSSSSFCEVTLDDDTAVSARFEPAPPTHKLTVSKAGDGSGVVSSSPAGISCGSDCSESFDEGTSVTLDASAGSDSRFLGWSGGGCSGTGSCSVTLNSETTVTARFIDTLATPDTAIDTGPPNRAFLNASAVTYSFSATPTETLQGFECRIDSASFQECSSPATFMVADEGSHTFDVRAVGTSGTPDPSPARRTFAIDRSPPGTEISAAPSAVGTSRSATFKYGALPTDDVAGFKCSVDGGAVSTCLATGWSGDGFADGSHTFAVQAIDAAGNVDATPATITWRVDATAPDTIAVAGPIGDGSASFTYSSPGGEAVSFECRMDFGSFGPCPASGKSYGGLGIGQHRFQVRATDALGNTDPTPATLGFEFAARNLRCETATEAARSALGTFDLAQAKVSRAAKRLRKSRGAAKQRAKKALKTAKAKLAAASAAYEAAKGEQTIACT